MIIRIAAIYCAARFVAFLFKEMYKHGYWPMFNALDSLVCAADIPGSTCEWIKWHVDRAWHNYVNLYSKVTNWFFTKTPKNSINQMVKCAKKLINRLIKWGNVLKGCLHQGGKSLWVPCMSAYYVKFYFPHAYTRQFCPTNYKRLQNVFNVVTKQRQSWNT